MTTRKHVNEEIFDADPGGIRPAFLIRPVLLADGSISGDHERPALGRRPLS